MMYGEKDNTWTDMVIMEPEEYDRFEKLNKLKPSFDILDKTEMNESGDDDGSDWDNTLLDGWIQLAAVSRKQYNGPQQMLAELEQWRVRFPNHPANYLLPTPLDSVKQHLFAAPKHIALLLPLTGPLAGPGNAIKDGFMAAYDASSRRERTTVRPYNTSSTDVAALYQQALSDGADYVVGPLSKPDVAQVATRDHPVPTVLLNDVEGKVYDNAYPFGLSPSNEARQVAAKARKNGYSRALVIAPSGSWGDDVVNAFDVQWRAGGGHGSKISARWR
jgi:outer membrane PBP1 activator LpoA protein